MFDTLFKMILFTAECQQVVGMRMVKAATGNDPVGIEAALMVSEKADAALRHLPALAFGGSLDQMLDDYREIVRANVARLAQA